MLITSQKDCIQWLIETKPYDDPESTPARIAYEIMVIWFGSVHAVATVSLFHLLSSAFPFVITHLSLCTQMTTFAIHALSLHPKYVEPLRKEILREYSLFERNGQGLPLLDSFIKESARVNPFDACTFLIPSLLLQHQPGLAGPQGTYTSTNGPLSPI